MANEKEQEYAKKMKCWYEKALAWHKEAMTWYKNAEKLAAPPKVDGQEG